eukprot:3166687-Rhodomonas_salina.5
MRGVSTARCRRGLANVSTGHGSAGCIGRYAMKVPDIAEGGIGRYAIPVPGGYRTWRSTCLSRLFVLKQYR